MKSFDYEDKDLVIIATLTIAIVAMFVMDESKEVVLPVITGMFGIVVGKRF